MDEDKRTYPKDKAGWEALLQSDIADFNKAHQAYRDDPENIDEARKLIPLDLREADLSGADLREADLSGADLSKANLINANLSRADLREADLREADLRKANLINANLSEANLIKANLEGSYLSKADLRGASLLGADLIRASLRGADLREADLEGANLINANLSRADLREAYLREADLRKANLLGADLRKANLREAYLSEANLSEARGIIVVSGDQINTETTKKMGKTSMDVEVDKFDHTMLLVDQGDNGIAVKRGCMYGSIETMFAHWDDYKYHHNAAPAPTGTMLDTLKTHRQTVMLPLLVDALQEAIVVREAERQANETGLSFPKAQEIFDKLETRYQDKYPGLFTNTPIVHADEVVHEGGLKGTGADTFKGGGAGREA